MENKKIWKKRSCQPVIIFNLYEKKLSIRETSQSLRKAKVSMNLKLNTNNKFKKIKKSRSPRGKMKCAKNEELNENKLYFLVKEIKFEDLNGYK